MIRIGFSLLLLAASAHAVIKSAGCGVEADFGSALGGPSRRFAVEHPAPDAQNRFANLHVAKKYDFNKPSPVIVAFHGKNQEIEAFEAATSLSDPEVNQDFIVVYPEAVNVSHPGSSKELGKREALLYLEKLLQAYGIFYISSRSLLELRLEFQLHFVNE